MNSRYSKEDAVERLRTLYSAAEEPDPAHDSHALRSFEADEYKVAHFEHPDVYRLVRADGMEPIEQQFTFFGIVCGKNLPPLMNPPKNRTAKVVRNFRQHARLTGLGESTFDQVAEAVSKAHKVFVEALGTEVSPPDYLPYEGHAALDTHARYFTDRKLSPFEPNLPFLPMVDPNNVLESLRGEKFIHGIDNQVEYAVKERQDAGGFRYKAYDPGALQIGDIVEVTLAFIAVPILQGKFKFIALLKGICLVDKTVREKSEHRRAPLDIVPGCSRNNRKRAVFLDEGEVAEARERLQRMRV